MDHRTLLRMYSALRRESAFLTDIEKHNRQLDCFSDKYRFPIVRADGSCSYVHRNGGTHISGSPTFTLPVGAMPLVCWEPVPRGGAVSDVIPGHDTECGPSFACPHCIQVRGKSGTTSARGDLDGQRD